MRVNGPLFISNKDDADYSEGSKLALDNISGHIETPSVKEYRLDTDAPSEYEVVRVTHTLVSGDCAGGFYINDTSIPGMDPVHFYPTERTHTATSANTVSEGDNLTLSIYENNSSADLSFGIKIKKL